MPEPYLGRVFFEVRDDPELDEISRSDSLELELRK
jgi:hypothetical protein